ncbi:MAG: D-glycero-beta-D-manno-heptose 1-phosphate adenylyltransferase [Alphaproteobacteria bacterium]|nr:D-glycero-beta-D-manno-heptose 1-phosphate adenylyltransferase [Alphaproteobacteria bacterium]
MLDRYLYGSVERVSPEAPVPVVRIERESEMLGGAGNVARNVVALGGQVAFVTVVGDDLAGRAITQAVGALARMDPFVLVDRGRTTTVKTRFVAGGQQLLRADREVAAPLHDDLVREIVRLASDAIAECDVVVLSDYAKGVLTPALIAAVIGRAEALGRPVVVDPKNSDFRRYRGAAAITPNRLELSQAAQAPVATNAEVVSAARRVLGFCKAEAMLVTRGAQGLSYIPRQGEPTHVPAVQREVFDPSGAGDTTIAAFATALGAGTPPAIAARLANLAGGIVVGKAGTAVADAAELLHAIAGARFSDLGDKVAGLDTAVARVAAWRAAGLSVSFTNGCFDLLHPGHLSLLTQARSECQRLVVGLNSDASVARLKGAGRPVQPEAARATVLAALEPVDLVVVFAEDTPLRLLEALKPDVLVKGADYRRDQVVGGDFVEGYGGRVALATMLSGHSTTRTIAKLAGER